MNKSAELAHLRKLIETLGPDSYIGPWLAQVAGSVEQDIRSDIFPAITLADSRKQCADIKSKAEAEARQIVVDAQAKASTQDKHTDQVIHGAAVAIQAALRALDNR